MASRSNNEASEVRIANFRIDAALFEELGERLVSRPEIALAELIKNAYDADAGVCDVTLGREEILVRDTGHGLTEGEFLSNWMVVSTQAKGQQRFSRTFARSMAGSKGVGRFSARFLGSRLELTSVAAAPSGQKTRLIAIFDWREIARQTTIATVRIPYQVFPVAKNTKLGTTLRISELREHVQDMAQDRVKSDVLKLIDPSFGLELPAFYEQQRRSRAVEVDPGFVVSFDGVGGADESSNLAADILNSYIGRVRLSVTEDGDADLRVYWRDEAQPVERKRFSLARYARAFTQEKLGRMREDRDARGIPVSLSPIQHLPVSTTLGSPVFIDLRFFPKRKGTFTKLGVNGFAAQRWVQSAGSFTIVDNAFAMPEYVKGESDWLGIEGSKSRNERSWQSIFTPAFYPMDATDRADPARNPMLALPRLTQIVGRIHVATHKQPVDIDVDDVLQPKMDRESLRNNSAFNLLWHLCRFSVETLANFDRKRRLDEVERREVEARKAARTSLSMAINEVRASEQIEASFRAKIVEQLKAVEHRFLESAAYEQDYRESMELMSLMGVLAGFMTHEFEKALGLLQAAARELKQLKLQPSLAAVGESIGRSEESLASFLDYMKLFIARARDPKVKPFKARGQVIVATDTLKAIADAHGIAITVEIDAKLPGPLVPVAAYHGIVINLVSNAMKALVPKAGREPRRIRVFATNESERHILVCADNGIGIPEYLRDRIWDPLFTTTNSDDANPLGTGLGLGLSVVQRVVQRLGGRIELLDSPPPGFSTAFRVQLPL